MAARRVAAAAIKAARAVAIIGLGVALGKAAQYAAVDLLGERLGFDGASAVGVGLFALAALALARWATRRGREKGRRNAPAAPLHAKDRGGV